MEAHILELTVHWEDVLLDVRHRGPDEPPLTLTSRTGSLWRLLGVPVGFVPEGFGPLLRISPPLVSEVRTEARGDVLLSPDALGPDEIVEIGEVRNGLPVVRLPAHWDPEASEAEAHLREDGRLLDDLGDRVYLLTDGLEVRFQRGPWRFALRAVTPAARVAAARLDADTPALLGWGAAWSFVLAMIALVGWLQPKPPMVLLIDDDTPERRVVMHTPPPPPPPPVTKGPASSSGTRGGRGARQAGPSGPAGGGGDPTDLFGDALSLLGGGSVTGPLSDLVQKVGQVRAGGSGPGEAGLGRRGSLRGGGDVEGLGSWGPGGPGDGSGGGPDAGGWGKEDREPTTTPLDPILKGTLTRGEVDAVVKRHLNAFRHCYQRALQHDATLAGKALVRFTIAGDGTVSRAGSMGLGSAVGDCLEDRFYKLRFPEPRGGGIVEVTYPFVFSPG